jgi:cytochrome c oxidase cbb3-type subunit 1
MKATLIPFFLLLLAPHPGWSQPDSVASADLFIVSFILLFIISVIACLLLVQVLRLRALTAKHSPPAPARDLIASMDNELVLSLQRHRSVRSTQKKTVTTVLMLLPLPLFAQSNGEGFWSQGGIIITLVLIAVPLILTIIFLIVKLRRLLHTIKTRQQEKIAATLADYLQQARDEEIDTALQARQASITYRPPSRLTDDPLAAHDTRGILRSIDGESSVALVTAKAPQRNLKEVLPQGKLILWYLGSAVFWLVLGTSVGEYLGIKFVAPEADAISWLSFGRLRPVHTNAVFWGWSSLAMLGLAYYVIPKVSNTNIASVRKGWITLVLINLSVILGSVCLMAGINNGGGEYREYIWPVMALFGAGLIITLINFLQTISRRKPQEIYISNWYIVSAIIFTLVIAFIAYWPSWQNGLGETIVQGYYMHQGVGMWFMLFNLGLVYYFLPQQVNKPIYSYGLGILAFWSQIIFYTLIGTHHFVFSSIPWWLQTTAIVGSAGMVIPVIAGTTNFYMTFQGAWHKMTTSYTLPFFFVGILFYVTGSLQGTAEAFRFTNLLWHFTDFTVAHSHLTMYGIIAFLLWGCIYVLVPRITGREPSHLLTGMHFWLAFIGLLFYTIPLMIGGTLKGLAWMEGKAFIESVTLMAPFWLWRAIGGSLMWLSHIVFAINFYRMTTAAQVSVKDLTFQKLQEKLLTTQA